MVGYALSFLTLVLGLIPGALWLAVWAGQRWSGRTGSVSKIFSAMSFAVLPLGFTTWIAFTVSFAFGKLSYILPVLSDPFGWGWDLLSLSPAVMTAQFSEIVPIIDVMILMIGLIWSAKNILLAVPKPVHGSDGKVPPLSRMELRAASPALVFSCIFTVGMLWLLIA